MSELTLEPGKKVNSYVAAAEREEAAQHASDLWDELAEISLPKPTQMNSNDIWKAIEGEAAPTGYSQQVDSLRAEVWSSFSSAVDPISVAEPQPLIPSAPISTTTPEPKPASLFDGVAPMGAQDLFTGDMKSPQVAIIAPESPALAIVPVQGGGSEITLASWSTVTAKSLSPITPGQEAAAASEVAAKAIEGAQSSQAESSMAERIAATMKHNESATSASTPIEASAGAANEALSLGDAQSPAGGTGSGPAGGVSNSPAAIIG